MQVTRQQVPVNWERQDHPLQSKGRVGGEVPQAQSLRGGSSWNPQYPTYTDMKIQRFIIRELSWLQITCFMLFLVRPMGQKEVPWGFSTELSQTHYRPCHFHLSSTLKSSCLSELAQGSLFVGADLCAQRAAVKLKTSQLPVSPSVPLASDRTFILHKGYIQMQVPGALLIVSISNDILKIVQHV